MTSFWLTRPRCRQRPIGLMPHRMGQDVSAKNLSSSPMPAKNLALALGLTLLIVLPTLLPLSAHAETLPARRSDKASNDRANSDRRPDENAIVAVSTVNSADNLPSLAAIMTAEFAADRGDMATALALYKQQAFHDNATAVFERGLTLSMANEDTNTALDYANRWQQQYPEHIPALFYVTHLALKAHNYQLAGQKLGQILQYDPDADLSQILIGIYPSQPAAQGELLAILQTLDTRDNPSLLVMKAGLLLQFNQPDQALIQINKALKKQPDSPAFMTLKADILQKTATPTAVTAYITTARRHLPDNKSLFLYQTRYLLGKGNSDTAWQLLNSNPKFLADDEIKLLAALVGLDSQHYSKADALLQDLTSNPDYRSQAYYYLGISNERQQKISQAIDYYGKVMQTDLVLNARKKQVDLLLAQSRPQEAIASMQKLRGDFDDFIPQSYIMQANILQKIGQSKQALALLNDAQKSLPDNVDILFAKVLLLPEEDYVSKRALLRHIVRLDPQNTNYQLEYAQVLVNQKIDDAAVITIVSPLINDTHYGLRARQIWAQLSLHRKDYAQVASLLADNFDIMPDVISGLLLHQAYLELHEPAAAQRISDIMQHELHYSSNNNLPTNGTNTAIHSSNQMNAPTPNSTNVSVQNNE